MALKWYGHKAIAHVRKQAKKRITKASIYLSAEAKEIVSRKQPTRGKGTRKRGLDPSKPGEAPKRVIGALMRSITWEVRDLDTGGVAGRIGTNNPVGRWMQLGTKKMPQPRPWLTLVLARSMGRLRRILEGNEHG